MRRAKHPVSLRLTGLTYNFKSGKYEIEENDITYSMGLEETRLLKEYFKWDVARLLSEWYERLDKETKKKIIRTGNVPKQPNDFYPDVEYKQD